MIILDKYVYYLPIWDESTILKYYGTGMNLIYTIVPVRKYIGIGDTKNR